MSEDRSESPADRWLKRIKHNRIIAGIVVIATISAGVFPFWDRALDVYRNYITAPVALESFYLTASSAASLKEENASCKEGSKQVRTFSSVSDKRSSAVPLDFVFSNNSKSDLIVKAVDVVISAVEIMMGGGPGIIVSQHKYVLNIEPEVGTQTFALTPNFRIPGNDSGAFTLVFSPAFHHSDRCWMMRLVFKTNLGTIRSDDFSVIMADVRRRSR